MHIRTLFAFFMLTAFYVGPASAADQKSPTHECSEYFPIFAGDLPANPVDESKVDARYYLLLVFDSYWPIPKNLIVDSGSGSIDFRTRGKSDVGFIQSLWIPQSIGYESVDDVRKLRAGSGKADIKFVRSAKRNNLTFDYFHTSHYGPGIQSNCLIVISDDKNSINLLNFLPDQVSDMYKIFLYFRSKKSSHAP